jgi:hypothetical protein
MEDCEKDVRGNNGGCPGDLSPQGRKAFSSWVWCYPVRFLHDRSGHRAEGARAIVIGDCSSLYRHDFDGLLASRRWND